MMDTFVMWNKKNNAQLKMAKTKQLVVNLSRPKGPVTPANTQG